MNTIQDYLQATLLKNPNHVVDQHKDTRVKQMRKYKNIYNYMVFTDGVSSISSTRMW